MKNSLKGLLYGLSSGMLWGLDTTLNNLLLLSAPFVLSDIRLISSALLLAFFHDFIAAIIISSDLLVRKNLLDTFKILKTKSALFVMLAALFAGPLGMRSYIYAVETIGAGLTATISALYPAVATLLGAIFLKDYLTRRGWMGLLLIIIAILIIGYSGITIEAQVLSGIIASLLCVFGWSSESVITAYGMKEDITPKQALFIRYWVSTFIYLVMMLFEGDLLFSLLSVISAPSFIIVGLMALIGTASYLCYYMSINKIGPVKATGLNVSYAIWASIFSVLILGEAVEGRLFICGFLIILGSILMIKE